jgi:signal transduction histidine kinase
VLVDEMLAAVGALVAPQAAAKGLCYEYRGGDPRVSALADGDRFRQIVLNLLSNAVKFTPTGGAVTMEWEAADATVVVRVRDTGVGMPRERLEEIFEPFVQLGTELSHPAAGTGLGLTISRELARAMGGDLTVTSTVGSGSTFTLTLPRVRSLE